MKAFVYKKYGGPDVLEMVELEKPVPRDNEVLIKIRAVSINEWDYGLLTGDAFIIRLMNGLFRPKKQVLGSDVAGVVEAIGSNIKKFKPGDEVYGDLSGKWGGFAEYVSTVEKSLALKPPSMSFEQAASIPQAGMLAVQGLVDKGLIKPGCKLLINGAGGGVGTFGIQIARQYENVEISVVDSEGKLEMLRSIGADHVIDYKKVDFTKKGELYDLILDVKTTRSIGKYLRVLKPGGSYVTVGGSMGRLFEGLLWMPWLFLFSKKKFRLVALKKNKDLQYMNGLFENGKMNPVIDGSYQLEDLVEAFKYYASAEHKGKLVISVSN